MSRSWQPPRLRLFEGTQRRATWLELLYDLVFVVAVAELADVLAEGTEPGRILAFIGLSFPSGGPGRGTCLREPFRHR